MKAAFGDAMPRGTKLAMQPMVCARAEAAVTKPRPATRTGQRSRADRHGGAADQHDWVHDRRQRRDPGYHRERLLAIPDDRVGHAVSVADGLAVCFSGSYRVVMLSMARLTAVTPSTYSPSFSLRIASRRCAPTLAAELASSGIGTTSAIDTATFVCLRKRSHVSG